MTKQIHAYLINPDNRTVTPVTLIDPDNLRAYYRLLDCDCVDTVGIDGFHTVWIDDEGLLKGWPAPHGYFKLKDQPFRPALPLAGLGLITGVSPSGDTISAKLSQEEAEAIVTFMDEIDIIRFAAKED